jgi:hypothetical protein
MSFLLKENFILEKGRRVWVYLFTIYLFVNFIIIYILLPHFLTPKGGGWHGLTHNTKFKKRGKGLWVFSFFNYYFIYF